MSLRLIGLSIVAMLAIGVGVYAYVFSHFPDLLPFEAQRWTADLVEQADEAIENVAPQCNLDSASLVDIPAPEPIDRIASEALATEVPTAIPPAYSHVPVVHRLASTKHMLGGLTSIPADREGEIRLSAIVGEDGDVLAVLPVSGPRPFFAQAVAIARRWKFEPYWRDGKRTIVRIDDLRISVGGKERRPEKRVAFPTVKDWSSLRVKFTRIPGEFGEAYEVTIRGDGTVTFNGRWNVAVLGRHCAVIPSETVRKLLEQFRYAEFFWLHDQYSYPITHAATNLISIEFDGHKKSVEDYVGSGDGMPAAVSLLEDYILKVVDADRWSKGNRLTGPTLIADGWDVTQNNHVNRSLLEGIVRYGTADAVRDVLALGARVDPASRDESLMAPWGPALVVAAARDDPAIVRAILGTNARWGQVALDGALLSRAQIGDLELMNDLIARGARPSLGHNGQTLLMHAAESGVPDVVSRVLNLQVDVSETDEDQATALHSVASPTNYGDVPSVHADRGAVVALLVEAGAKVDARDKYGNTPLMANWLGYEDVTAALMKAGASVNARDDSGATALSGAPTPAIASLLLKGGADPLLGDGLALRQAADDDRFDVLRFLLRVRIRWTKSTLGAALYHVAARSEVDLADELIKRGVDVNARSERKRTPLMGAAMSGLPTLVTRVLAERPDVNAADESGDTALHLARRDFGDRYMPDSDWTRTVEVLLDAGADIHRRNQYGRTLMHACPDQSVVELLIARGAKVDDRDSSGETALMRCAWLSVSREAHIQDTVKYLLEHGANPSLRNKEGRSALDIAKRGSGDPILERVFENEVKPD
jgi:ankyrin repeat protein